MPNIPLRRKLLPAIALAVVLAALALAAALRHDAPQPAREPTTAVAQEADSPYQFLLKTQRQTLELFHMKPEGWQKLAEFPITLGDLPEADQELLQTGLVLRDSQELQRSLEDYLPNS